MTESIDETSPWELCGTRQQRLFDVSTRQGVRLSVTFLPFASFAKNEELLLGAPEKILKATLLPEGEALGHLGRSTEAWRYRGQLELRAPSSSSAESSLPRAMPCQHCTLAAIMRRRHLEQGVGQ